MTELVGMTDTWFKGYQKALDDLQLEIHKSPVKCNDISIELVDEIIVKLRVKT